MRRNQLILDGSLKDKIQALFDDFVSRYELDIKLSFIVPIGYETSNGTFDISKKTLYLNFDHIKDKPEYEIFYILFHELRHAEQYIFPHKFSIKIQDSIPYVVLYDGRCFKMVDGEWLKCKLNKSNCDFIKIYKSLPYELDANKFAYIATKKLFKNKNEIKKLYLDMLPKRKMKYSDLKNIFSLINQETGIKL